MKRGGIKSKRAKGPNKVFVQSLVNRNIGSRTGKNVKAGKNIVKDKDGFDNFDAYWSESDADVTSNTTVHSIFSANNDKDKLSCDIGPISSSQPLASIANSTRQSFNSYSSQPIGGAAAYYFGRRDIGSRTGKNIKAGKKISKQDDGFENFENYWSESEPDSILSFHKSLRANDSKSSFTHPADTPKEEEEDISIAYSQSDSEGVLISRRDTQTDTSVSLATGGSQEDSEGEETPKATQNERDTEEEATPRAEYAASDGCVTGDADRTSDTGADMGDDESDLTSEDDDDETPIETHRSERKSGKHSVAEEVTIPETEDTHSISVQAVNKEKSSPIQEEAKKEVQSLQKCEMMRHSSGEEVIDIPKSEEKSKSRSQPRTKSLEHRDSLNLSSASQLARETRSRKKSGSKVEQNLESTANQTLNKSASNKTVNKSSLNETFDKNDNKTIDASTANKTLNKSRRNTTQNKKSLTNDNLESTIDTSSANKTVNKSTLNGTMPKSAVNKTLDKSSVNKTLDKSTANNTLDSSNVKSTRSTRAARGRKKTPDSVKVTSTRSTRSKRSGSRSADPEESLAGKGCPDISKTDVDSASPDNDNPGVEPPEYTKDVANVTQNSARGTRRKRVGSVSVEQADKKDVTSEDFENESIQQGGEEPENKQSAKGSRRRRKGSESVEQENKTEEPEDIVNDHAETKNKETGKGSRRKRKGSESTQENKNEVLELADDDGKDANMKNKSSVKGSRRKKSSSVSEAPADGAKMIENEMIECDMISTYAVKEAWLDDNDKSSLKAKSSAKLKRKSIAGRKSIAPLDCTVGEFLPQANSTRVNATLGNVTRSLDDTDIEESFSKNDKIEKKHEITVDKESEPQHHNDDGDDRSPADESVKHESEAKVTEEKTVKVKLTAVKSTKKSAKKEQGKPMKKTKTVAAKLFDLTSKEHDSSKISRDDDKDNVSNDVDDRDDEEEDNLDNEVEDVGDEEGVDNVDVNDDVGDDDNVCDDLDDDEDNVGENDEGDNDEQCDQSDSNDSLTNAESKQVEANKDTTDLPDEVEAKVINRHGEKNKITENTNNSATSVDVEKKVSDFKVIPVRSSKSTASNLNIGGDVTGSISKNTDAKSAVSNTPMHSFRTKKRFNDPFRLSYSRILDESGDKERQESLSSRDSSLARPPPILLQSVEEEEEEEQEGGTGSDDPPTDFLSLRPSAAHQASLSDDSLDDNFWIVDDHQDNKKKRGRPKSISNVKEEKGEDNNKKSKGRKSGTKKSTVVKGAKGAKKRVLKGKKSVSGDETSETEPEASSSQKSKKKPGRRKKKGDMSAGDDSVEGDVTAASSVDISPTAVKKRKSSVTPDTASVSGSKKSKSAKVTKTKEIMKGTDNSIISKAGRLSHLHLAGMGETPKSGISFRQRRRRSMSEPEARTMNVSCPVDLSFSPHRDEMEAGDMTARKRLSLDGTPVVDPRLTSCLGSGGKSVNKKKRRVTISNIVEKASVTYSDSTVSDSRQSPLRPVMADCTNTSVKSTPGLDFTGSPIHFFETTNTERPDPITAPPKSKIILPMPGPDGLRRSKRVRLQPLEWYKNEHVIYERRKSGNFVIAGVQPSKEAEYVAAEKEKRKKRALLRLKRSKSCKLSRSRLISRPNLSLHQDVPVDLDYAEDSELPVINPESGEEVLVDCVAPVDTSKYEGGSGGPPKEGEPFIMCHAIQQPFFTAGHMLIAPLAEKTTQLLQDNTVIFTIVHGKLLVTIHRGSTVLEAGDQFFIPRGNTYSLKNMRNEEAKLSFVNLVDTEQLG